MTGSRGLNRETDTIAKPIEIIPDLDFTTIAKTIEIIPDPELTTITISVMAIKSSATGATKTDAKSGASTTSKVIKRQ